MVIYGVTLMPLMETVRVEQPDILQAWYADDSSFGGTAPMITAAMCMIMEKPCKGLLPQAKQINLDLQPGHVRCGTG